MRMLVAVGVISYLLPLTSYLFSSCAKMGSPDGGWYDDDPPKVVGSVPADQSVNVKSKKVTIYFDEYIKLEDATNKVIISPPQLEAPEIKGSGKKVVVELQDTLKENTTYTIDFSDAIVDNNEGNPLGSYAFTFSTGEHVDTFEVSGYVLDASNLEPIKGIMVGLYDDLADSAFKTKPLLRVSRTDSRGHFVVKGIAPGTYRAYALQDMDNDFHFTQRGEMLAFNHETFSPSSKPDTRIDTIWRDSLHIDALIPVPYTHFLPDDITLLAFNHILTDRYLLKTERKDAEKISLFFTYGHPELPVIKGMNFEADSAFVIEANEKQDTIHYWLRDTALVNQDTLRMEISYMMTDTLGNLVSQTDTLDVLAKTSYEKRMKDKAKEIEKWQKEQEKKKKRDQPYDSIYPVQPLKLDIKIPSAMVPDEKVRIEVPNPLVRCDTSAIHLYSQIDSLWYEAAFEFKPVPGTIRQFEITADWRPNTEYSLEIDSAAFENIYGLVSDKFKQGMSDSRASAGRIHTDLGNMAHLSCRRIRCLRPFNPVHHDHAADRSVLFIHYNLILLRYHIGIDVILQFSPKPGLKKIRAALDMQVIDFLPKMLHLFQISCLRKTDHCSYHLSRSVLSASSFEKKPGIQLPGCLRSGIRIQFLKSPAPGVF